MKSKITEWGNSHGIRISNAMMERLNVNSGDEIEINLTNNGVEINKNPSSDYVKSISKEVLSSLINTTEPVKIVNDPNAVTEVSYSVIDVNPCKPVIREVAKDSQNSFSTLADAKEASRQILQTALNDAKKSLSDLRQVGVEKINYITL